MDIPYDLLKIVSGFLIKPRMKLLDYIPIDKLDRVCLSKNPNAIDLLEEHPIKIYWPSFISNPNFRQVMRICEKYSDISTWDKELGEDNLSLNSPFLLRYNYHNFKKSSYYWLKNPNAIDILAKHNNLFSMQNWEGISENPNAMFLLEDRRAKIHWDSLYKNPNPEIIRILEKKNPKKINWDILSMNPNVITFLEKHLDKVNWHKLSQNPNAIHILESVLQHDPDKINWNALSGNINAIHILEKYPEKINWNELSGNINAIHILETVLQHNPEKINWAMLSENPNALHLLEKHPEKINYDRLFFNPNLLEAIHLIKPEQEHMLWEMLSKNPSIFEIDRIQYNKDVIKKTENILY